MADEAATSGGVASNGARGLSGQIDQIKIAVDQLKNNRFAPHYRRRERASWTRWPRAYALSILADGKLSCQLYQRSADIFLGVPFFCDYQTYSHARTNILSICFIYVYIINIAIFIIVAIQA
jgi:hypothetical protein